VSDDDQTLVRAAKQGDRQALDQLLRRHYDRIFGLCRRITANDADAADAAQEALLGICRGLPRFDGSARFSTWVYRVTTNACLDELRRRKRRPLALVTADGLVAPVRGPEDATVAAVDLDRALARLPVEFRTAVALRDLLGLDYAEIAEVLSIPPGTVRSRIARGRAALADLLGNPDPPGDRPTT
jgi:RNA polymerase sigma-70 factor (ECF subfamily)